MPEYPLKILFGILLAVSIGPVLAHSFNLGFIIPLSGPHSESGKQALDGFMLATTEEDSHADETSDGHLGGLDSHVLKVDSGIEVSLMLKNLENLVDSHEPLFVTGLFTADTADLVGRSLMRGNSVFFDPSQSSMWIKTLGAPDTLQLMNQDLFSARFENSYGYFPTLEVKRGYIAARLIAATVRSLSEEALNDPNELAVRLAQYQKNLQ